MCTMGSLLTKENKEEIDPTACGEGAQLVQAVGAPHQCGHFPGAFSGPPCFSASSHSCRLCTQTWHPLGKPSGAAQNYKTSSKGSRRSDNDIPTDFKHHSRLL